MKEHLMENWFRNVWVDRLDRMASALPFLIGITALVAGFWYCLKNCSGHSAVSPFEGSVCFIPVAAMSLMVMFHRKEGYFLKVGSLGLVVAVAGALFGGFVHAFGIMREYGAWIGAGMPEKNPHTEMLLIGYSAITLVLLSLVARFAKVGGSTAQ